MIDLEGGPCVAKRSIRLWFRYGVSGSDSMGRSLSMSSVCRRWRHSSLGNVDDGIVRPEIADDFQKLQRVSQRKCRSCFARFYCSGGCMANSYKFHNTIHDTYDVSCEMERKRVECAIMIKAALWQIMERMRNVKKSKGVISLILIAVLTGLLGFYNHSWLGQRAKQARQKYQPWFGSGGWSQHHLSGKKAIPRRKKIWRTRSTNCRNVSRDTVQKRRFIRRAMTGSVSRSRASAMRMRSLDELGRPEVCILLPRQTVRAT